PRCYVPHVRGRVRAHGGGLGRADRGVGYHRRGRPGRVAARRARGEQGARGVAGQALPRARTSASGGAGVAALRLASRAGGAGKKITRPIGAPLILNIPRYAPSVKTMRAAAVIRGRNAPKTCVYRPA